MDRSGYRGRRGSEIGEEEQATKVAPPGDAASERSGPRRRCVACRASAPTGDLLRIAWPAGAAGPAVGRTLSGRGAWVHPVSTCVGVLCQGDLSRAFRRKVTPTQMADLFIGLTAISGANSVELPDRRPAEDG